MDYNQGTPFTGIGPLDQAMATAASGMRSQSIRLRIVSENMANANSTASTPGGDPYRRKTVSFDQVMDKATGAMLVVPKEISTDQSAFHMEYNPSHPAADANGYVKTPNVTAVIEAADMRESENSYNADLTVLTQARQLIAKTLDILKG
jgi:flagellar basal-body rod protein FlgC